MEAAGLAIGITALYTTCRDCYDFFTAARKAEAESSSHLRELQIQQSILKAWGFHWQIQSEDSREPRDPGHITRKRNKLQHYLSSNRFKAEGVFKTLSALADTLSNQEKLGKRYGVRLQPMQPLDDTPGDTSGDRLVITDVTIENVTPVINEVKRRLSVLNKLKWALKDKDKFNRLITELKSHSESLYRLCPENAYESMNVYLTMECLARQESPVALKSTSKLAITQADEAETSAMTAGYELLASAAALKASVNENRSKKQSSPNNLASVEEEQKTMRYLGKGLALYKDQVVYVEMRDYRGPPLELTAEQKRRIERRKIRETFLRGGMTKHELRGLGQSVDFFTEEGDEPIEVVRPADPELRALISTFFNTFKGEKARESVFGLDIAGMIDHAEGEYKGHCSILYKLPSTIGIQNRERPAENLKLRAPVTLQSLLGTRQNHFKSTLGARFELARKLVRAVCLLHSSGWLHKNIRAESVVFFPEHVSSLQEDRYELKIEIDVSNPILMGYVFSRPDDIIMQLAPRPTPVTGSDMVHVDEDSEDYGHDISLHTLPPPMRSNSRTWNDPVQNSELFRHRPGPPRSSSIHGFNTLEKTNVAAHAKKTNVSGFTLDYYQHPAKHANPQRLYCHAYDVYSLGILLIEVGLWQELDEYDENDWEHGDEEDHYERRRWICRRYLDDLRWACGDTYADVVLSCLMMDSSDDEVSKASERELCARIVADLEGCRA